jgi:hypothetical protein
MTPQILKKQTHKPEIRVIKLLQMISGNLRKGNAKEVRLTVNTKLRKVPGFRNYKWKQSPLDLEKCDSLK